MGYIKLLGGFLLVMIFSIAIVSYVVFYTNDNASSVNLDQDFNDFNSDLQANGTLYYNEVNTSSDNIFKSTVSEGSQTTVSGQGLKGGISTLYTSVSSIFDLISSKIFGGDPRFTIFLTMIGAFILFVMAVYFIKMWIGANPD